MRILYSQSWEDPLFLNESLRVNAEDAVLSVTSSGDNTLFLLAQSPARLVSIDHNPAQNHLLELKAAGIQSLDHEEFLEFIGVLDSERRPNLYSRARGFLCRGATLFWDNHPSLIETGVIHCGKFESYLAAFRRYVLPLSQSRKEVDALLGARSLEEQKKLYDAKWDNLMWRLSFRIFFSEFFLRKGRDEAFFRYHSKRSVAGQYLMKTKRGLTEVPLRGNYFLRYILTGNYDPDNLPEYLQEENFARIKANIGRMEIRTSDIGTYLEECAEGQFTKYNLSDIFELNSQKEYLDLLKQVLRVSRDGAVLCYWNHLVRRREHPELDDRLYSVQGVDRGKVSDRVFFYDDFIAESVRR